jgi:hypothetical protein
VSAQAGLISGQATELRGLFDQGQADWCAGISPAFYHCKRSLSNFLK